MTEDKFSRMRLIYGDEAMEKLSNSRVAVFGVGGVGGYVVEGLIRGGLGAIDIIDNDIVSITNLNRQIIATAKNIGENKVDAAKERILSINPQAKVTTYKLFYSPETSNQIDFSKFNYIVDAIDSITGKIELIVQAKMNGVPIISSMGAGNKTDPTAFEVTDIYKTSVCPLERVMRHELKKRGIKSLKVVYSKEAPIKPKIDSETLNNDEIRKPIPGSTSFVPSVAGLIIAGTVINDLTGR